jgi:hypothetical protein
MPRVLNGTRREIGLAGAVLFAVALAVLAPPVPQHPHYHQFADQRTLLGLPCAMDVLSNALFAFMGLWGLRALRRTSRLTTVQQGMAALFFGGLVLTALASGWYHLNPDDAGLAVDRLGMTVAFAGLLGWATATQISERAAMLVSTGVLAWGAAGVTAWLCAGNLLPWAVLQGMGLVLLCVCAWLAPLPGAPRLPWALVVAWYVAAKVFELGDQEVFAATGWLSGHSIKHGLAACAAWPVIVKLDQLGQNATQA